MNSFTLSLVSWGPQLIRKIYIIVQKTPSVPFHPLWRVVLPVSCNSVNKQNAYVGKAVGLTLTCPLFVDIACPLFFLHLILPQSKIRLITVLDPESPKSTSWIKADLLVTDSFWLSKDHKNNFYIDSSSQNSVSKHQSDWSKHLGFASLPHSVYTRSNVSSLPENFVFLLLCERSCWLKNDAPSPGQCSNSWINLALPFHVVHLKLEYEYSLALQADAVQ